MLNKLAVVGALQLAPCLPAQLSDVAARWH